MPTRRARAGTDRADTGERISVLIPRLAPFYYLVDTRMVGRNWAA